MRSYESYRKLSLNLSMHNSAETKKLGFSDIRTHAHQQNTRIMDIGMEVTKRPPWILKFDI